jgi:hypothetical protein
MCEGEIVGVQGSRQEAIAVMQATVSNVRG